MSLTEMLDPATETGELSDEVLMSRYSAFGGAKDFEMLFQRYQNQLFRYLARYTGDGDLAKDVCQNTFLQLHTKRHLYEEGHRVRPWLYAIATHQAVDALRKLGRHPTVSLDQTPDAGASSRSPFIAHLVSSIPEPFDIMAAEESALWVRHAIDQLSDVLRVTFTLARLQGLKYREIATVLEISVGTVKSRLYEALLKLQEMARAEGMQEEAVEGGLRCVREETRELLVS